MHGFQVINVMNICSAGTRDSFWNCVIENLMEVVQEGSVFSLLVHPRWTLHLVSDVIQHIFKLAYMVLMSFPLFFC